MKTLYRFDDVGRVERRIPGTTRWVRVTRAEERDLIKILTAARKRAAKSRAEHFQAKLQHYAARLSAGKIGH